MVFYRKYRPQTIDELDSASVRDTLQAVLQKNIPHAFLFTGPKGLGKTSTARIVAKVVNCQNRKKDSVEPCNTCDQCVSITNGTNVDILEIDAASNRGIDEIRDLKEKIRLAPVSARKKVYIIDEVHMLTTEAFNALLKTLEEPPDHAIFILCTTESHKVPETIVSRCFQIMFKPATEEELVRSFKRIVVGEKLTFKEGEEEKVLQYIAKISDRGFRDGVKVLEEVALLANGEEITIESFEKSYKTTTILLQVIKLLTALNKYDAKEGIGVIKELLDGGVDLKFFITQVLGDLHKKLLDEMQVETQNTVPVNVKFDINKIKTLVELFSKAYGEMKTAVLPQLPLELAVIEWCSTEQNEIKESKPPQNGVKIKAVMTEEEAEVSVSTLRKQVGNIKKIKALYGEKAAKTDAAEEEVVVSTTTVELMHTPGDGSITKEWLDMFWNNLINEMKQYNHTVAGVLRGCTIKSYADQELIIQTAYKFHKERLDDMRNRDALLRISKLLTGKDIDIKVELKK